MQELFIPLSERENLNRFPSDIPEDDLIAYFTLSTVDKELLVDRRGDHNHLGFAVQLCTLRYLGYCPDELAHIPQHVIAYLGKQLALKHPDLLIRQYGQRVHTRTDHLQEIISFVGYAKAKRGDLEELESSAGIYQPGRIDRFDPERLRRPESRLSAVRFHPGFGRL